MKNIVQTQSRQFNITHKKRKYLQTISMILSAIVVFTTTYVLIIPAITWERSLLCGFEEHIHTESCYDNGSLVCEKTEHIHTDACFDAPPAYDEGYNCGYVEHTHNEYCYFSDGTLRCTVKEHKHSLACKSDKNSDVETEEEWVASFSDALILGNANRDVLEVARTQVGYTESAVNYDVVDGQVKGYTRYGDWFGSKYSDWSAIFCKFCMYYTDSDHYEFSSDVAQWFEKLSNLGNLLNADTHTADEGNIVFYKVDGKIHVGIAEKLNDNGTITLIEGDVDGKVARINVSSDNVIGYILPSFIKMKPLLKLLSGTKSETGYWIKATEIDDDEARYMIVSVNGNCAIGVSGTGTTAAVSAAEVTMKEAVKIGTTQYYTAGTLNTDKLYQWDFSTTGNSSQKLQNVGNTNRWIRIASRTAVGSSTNATSNTLTYNNGNWTINSGSYYLIYNGTDFTGSNSTSSTNRARRNMTVYKFVPAYTVTLDSGEANAQPYTIKGVISEKTLTDMEEELAKWEYEGHSFVGWSADGGKTVLTDEELLAVKITDNVTYTAQWAVSDRKVTFDLGEYASDISKINDIYVQDGTGIAQEDLPIPLWNVDTPLPFEGWYTDSERTVKYNGEPINQNITLYAKFGSADMAFYVYYYDYDRGTGESSVMRTYAVSEGDAAPYYNLDKIFPPEGKVWDGKWYFDADHTLPYQSQAVSSLSDYLTGVNNRDLYLYPGMTDTCRVVFVTNGTRIPPKTVAKGDKIDLSDDDHTPSKIGNTFVGWYADEKFTVPVSGVQTINESTTFYAKWEPGYTPFVAVRHSENADNYGMTSTGRLGTWYAISGSTVYVKTTGSGTNFTHKVYCKTSDGVEHPVYTSNADGSMSNTQATIADLFDNYFIFCNESANGGDGQWETFTDLAKLEKRTYIHPVVCDGLENGTVLSSGESIVAFAYLRVRADVTFTIYNKSKSVSIGGTTYNLGTINGNNNNGNNGGYFDMYTIFQNGLIQGSCTDPDGNPLTASGNKSAKGTFTDGVQWMYTAGNDTDPNLFVLQDVKYEGSTADKWPQTSWFTINPNANSGCKFEEWPYANSSGVRGQQASKVYNLTSGYYKNGASTGRNAQGTTFYAQFDTGNNWALFYAIECLKGETPDFTINGVGYKVNDGYSNVLVNSATGWTAKEIKGCLAGKEAYTRSGSTTHSGTSVISDATVNGWIDEMGVNSSDYKYVRVFYYNREKVNVTFDFNYDDDPSKKVNYTVSRGENLSDYRYGTEDGSKHDYLNRSLYRFIGWMNQFDELYTDSDWDKMIADIKSGDSALTFYAKWEPVKGSIIEFYTAKGIDDPFETHIFLDGTYIKAPTSVKPNEGWVWTNSDTEKETLYTGDFPLYGGYGVIEQRDLDGSGIVEDVYVIKVYGVWSNAVVDVQYNINTAQGGNIANQPTDPIQYTPGDSRVSVMAPGIIPPVNSQNKIFAGWELNKNKVIYYPGDHVPVNWSTTLIFTAQWIDTTEAVKLVYNPNGGTPNESYPNADGYVFKRNANANVWNNMDTDTAAHYTRSGYNFAGWNTGADGKGTWYYPDDVITLSADVTTLYAQWEPSAYSLIIHKVSDDETPISLSEAGFRVDVWNGSEWIPVVTSLISDEYGMAEIDDVMVYGELYRITETKAPNGYILSDEPIYFRFSADGQVIYCDENGDVLSSVSRFINEQLVIPDRTNSELTLAVINAAGVQLPATGGKDTTPLIYALGVSLMVCALMTGRILRRRSEGRGDC